MPPDPSSHPTRPGRVRRWGLRGFATLPRTVRVALVRAGTPNYTIGALALIEHEGHLLVLRQLHRQGWTLPGGLSDRGEQPERTVVREVAEETGLAIAVDLPLATVVDPDWRRVDLLFHVPVDHRPPVVPRSEAVEAAWLRPDQVGEVDPPTQQALAMLERARADRTRQGRLLPPA